MPIPWSLDGGNNPARSRISGMLGLGRLADVPMPLHRGNINHRDVDAATQNRDANCREGNPQARRPVKTDDRANQHCYDGRYRPDGCIMPNAPKEEANSVRPRGRVRPHCKSIVISLDHNPYVSRTLNVGNWAKAPCLPASGQTQNWTFRPPCSLPSFGRSFM